MDKKIEKVDIITKVRALTSSPGSYASPMDLTAAENRWHSS